MPRSFRTPRDRDRSRKWSSRHRAGNEGATTGLRTYIYEPLSPDECQIRVLDLWRGSFASPIHITLRSTQFTPSRSTNQNERYEALSYTVRKNENFTNSRPLMEIQWGSAQDPADICVHAGDDSAKLSVTRNLEEALRHLRLQEAPRTLWIDAICINQQNIQERSDQVAIMADIYANAAAVVIWVGPQSDDSDIALDCVETLSAHVTIIWTGICEATWASAQDGDPLWVDPDQLVPFTRDQMVALSRFFFRPYFERLWVWQEIHSNYDQATMLCGQRRLPWSQICGFLIWLVRKDWPGDHLEALKKRVYQLQFLCRPSGLTALLALNASRWCKCLDPRDRVFATARLGKTRGFEIRPDYSKSVTHVYTEVAVSLMTPTNQLDMLHCVDSLASNLTLPSWIPDWSAPANTMGAELMHAHANTLAIVKHVDTRRLTVIGKIVGRIQSIVPGLLSGEARQLGSSSIDHVQLMRKFMEMAQSAGIVDMARLDHVKTLGLALFQDLHAERFIGPTSGTLFGKVLDIKDIHQLAVSCTSSACPQDEQLEKVAYQGLRNLAGKAVFASEPGRYGMAPLGAEPGDLVAVLLGYVTPVIMRELSDGEFMLLGDAYYDGVVQGEAILGPLPPQIRFVCNMEGTDTSFQDFRFHDVSSGRLQTEDPRLENVPLPAGWQKGPHPEDPEITIFWHEQTQKSTEADPRLRLEELESRGFEPETFTFV